MLMSNILPGPQDNSSMLLSVHDTYLSCDLQDRYVPLSVPEHVSKHSSVSIKPYK